MSKAIIESGEIRLEISSDLAVRLRPLEEDDVDELLDLFAHMGPESRYNRFHTPLTHPGEDFVLQWAAILADVPPERGEAWLILGENLGEPETVIGGGRFVYVGEEERQKAEVSLAIRDDMQGKGIGSRMLQFLADEARKIGVKRLVANIISSNLGAVGILERLTYPVSYTPVGSEVDVEVDLTRLKKELEWL